MNKKIELVEAIAAKMHVTKKDATEIVDTFAEVITDGLIKDSVVKIPGVGTFEVRDRKERNGVNPATGEPIVVPACKTVGVKVAKALKEVVK